MVNLSEPWRKITDIRVTMSVPASRVFTGEQEVLSQPQQYSDHRLGDIYLDEDSHLATGVDGVVVRKTEWGDTIKLTTSRLPNLKPLKIYCDQDDVTGKKVMIDNDRIPVIVSSFRKPGENPLQ